jgi:cholest-4-en-3-one 26-monooxygenase
MTDTVAPDLSPDSFATAVPHELFAHLRREQPVSWQEADGTIGHWAIVRHADVVAVSRDPQTFASGHGIELVPLDDAASALAHHVLISTDPPRHTKLRLLVNRGFTPRMITRLDVRIRELATATVDALEGRDECDLVHDIAFELPALVIAELMGLPAEDRALVVDWAGRIFGLQDAEGTSSSETFLGAATEMFEYASELAATKRANPGDDIVSALLQAEVDGERLEELDFDCFFLLLNLAGVETTQTLVAQGMLALLDRPDDRARLADDPSLLPGAVEEMLRWVTPVHGFARVATTDTELHGVPIRAGDRVALWYAAANRDETVFEDPDTFDIDRDASSHVSFGAGGPHYCLGAHLARLEACALLEELLTRAPQLELAGTPVRMRSNAVNALRHAPVRVGALRSRSA